MPGISVINAPKMQRVNRSPIHPSHIKCKPFQIQPFMVAPVLPGETLQNLNFQARIVTDPIKNSLIGWHAEHYWFYVAISQLGESDFIDMFLDLDKNMSSYAPTASSADFYVYDDNGGIDWLQRCYQRIVEAYFRDEGEAWNSALIGNLAAAQLNVKGFFDSMRDTTTLDDGGTLSELNATAGNITQEQLKRARSAYEFLLANDLTNMSYSDFLQTYGVRGGLAEDPKRPELLRYTRNWQYPSNTVDPTDGSVASAVSWSLRERADKKRFFNEPGFIVGLTCFRPKVYMGKQKGTLTQWLDNALAWMPAIMADDPSTSLREFTNAQGPFGGEVTNGYWIDLRDLFLYGEQFCNFDVEADTSGIALALPTATQQWKYPTEAMVDTLFSADTAELVRMDAVTSLQISGTQMDATPRTVGNESWGVS